MKTILLKFSGPLQSWGTSSHFESRHTDFYPSKSAVIGLISACFGFRRYEDKQIRELNELDFAVRVDWQGNLMYDYHTATKNKPNGDFERNYVTKRYYLEDAVFLVAISHEDENFIDKIFNALKNPYFQSFMGRRSLPLCFDFILGTYDRGPIELLSDFPWQASKYYQESYKKKGENKALLEIYADKNLIPDFPSNLRQDRVISFSQKHRRFGFRYEARKTVQISISDIQTEHDVFNAL